MNLSNKIVYFFAFSFGKGRIVLFSIHAMNLIKMQIPRMDEAEKHIHTI